MANERKYIDPDVLALHAKYRQQGLTTTSNNTSIIPRDTAGNIQYHENATNNALLIIEPVATKIITKSVLKVIDTQFQYFKFPATTRVIPGVVNINLDLASDLPDLIYARYKPSANQTINTVDSYAYTPASGILMDEIEGGDSQKNTNSYYITNEIKNSGKNLRFRVKINHRSDAPNTITTVTETSELGSKTTVTSTSNTIAQTFFTIIKAGPNFELDRNYKPGYINDGEWNSRPLFYVHDNPVENINGIEQPAGSDKNSPASIEQYNVYSTEIDVIIQNSEFEIGDNFNIGACGKYGPQSINSEQTYWVITDASKNVDLWNQEIA